jgi:hypothetical protein
VTYRTCRENKRTALLEIYMLTGPRHLADLLTELIRVGSLTALGRTQVKTLLATIHVAIVGYHGKSCLSGCCLNTDLRKRYLVTEVHNMREVSMGGFHTSIRTVVLGSTQPQSLTHCRCPASCDLPPLTVTDISLQNKLGYIYIYS